MTSIIEGLTNTSYKTLKKLYECQVTLPDGSSYIPTSQADMAKIIGVNAMTMNRIFKQFAEQELVLPIQGKRSKYILTDKAKMIIDSIDSLENKIEGSNK